MVSDVPTAALDGEMLLMDGPTVKLTPLLETPATVTTTLPVVAPVGTGATMLVALQLVGEAFAPPKETVLDPCVAPKPDPLMITEVPGPPEPADKLLMTGVTVKVTPLLARLPTVTITGPVVAFAGTGTTICVPLQLVGEPGVPLKVTVLDPCVAPK
jgi:hypothetical protein